MLRDALQRGIAASDAMGGTTQAGLWFDDSPTPMEAGDAMGPSRLWSLSKPVTAVAALRGVEPKGGPSPGLTTAIADAITKSGNCAQREVALFLQASTGGVAPAKAAFDAVLHDAGVSLSGLPASSDITGSPECRPHLPEATAELKDPYGPAVQFGTAQWRFSDALRFAHALASGAYGKPGDTVLELMRRPKESAPEGGPADYTASLQEPPSAGTFPTAWRPAYKGGWGGRSLPTPDFRATEIVVLDVASHRVALAAAFRPTAQPGSDDPGMTAAPKALSALFATLERAFVLADQRS